MTADEPPGAPAGERGAPAYGVVWSIKSSFVTYVLGMPDGRASATDGAWPLPDARIVYELDPTVPQEDLGRGWAFRGDVRFAGHFGMLFVRIADPWVVWADDGITLTIADPDVRDESRRVAIATRHLERGAGDDGSDVWLSTDVALTEQGALLFNEVYPVGSPLDPLIIRLPRPDPRS